MSDNKQIMSHNNQTPQLNTFQVVLTTGQIRNEPIENITELDEIIRIYGRGIIAEITFYFYDNQHQFHNIILRNSGHNDRFIVEFYHYYNRYMERIEMNREDKMRDFTVVMNCINNVRNLNSRLMPYIIDPFQRARTLQT